MRARVQSLPNFATRTMPFGLALIALVSATPLRAQTSEPSWFLEGRVDLLASGSTALHPTLGANTAVGTYARVAVLAGAGIRWRSDDWRRSGRVEVVGRLHLDPFQQARRGIYVGGGATVLLDERTGPRTRMLVVVGVEGRRTRGGWVSGVEAGLGGGVRLAVSIRQARARLR